MKFNMNYDKRSQYDFSLDAEFNRKIKFNLAPSAMIIYAYSIEDVPKAMKVLMKKYGKQTKEVEE